MSKVENYETRTHGVRAMKLRPDTRREDVLAFVGAENFRPTQVEWQVKSTSQGWVKLPSEGGVVLMKPNEHPDHLYAFEAADFAASYTPVDRIDEVDVQQMAMYQQKLDALQNGGMTDKGDALPRWSDVGPVVQEEYRQDAARAMRMLLALGYRKQAR